MEPANTRQEVRNRKPQAVEPEEEFVLEDLYDSVDFDFNLNGVHSDVGNLFQQFAKKEVIKVALKKKAESSMSRLKQRVEKAEVSVERQKEKIKTAIKARKNKLEEKIKAPPFLRTSDKCAFTLGIVSLCITEYILLKSPQLMPLWYTFLIFPLLTARYYFYSRAKFHYFMLDFCYYVQVLLLADIYYFKSPELFQVIFALSNGPLCVAIVMWRNSLVFHDLDKITSVFIHIFPPLVTFSFRWYPPNGDFSKVCTEPDCSMSPYYAVTLALVFYGVWQILYLLKTELLDKEKLARDNELMTSVRWMTQVKPHPIYNMMLRKGLKPNPVAALTAVQGIYTAMTLVPIIPIFQYFELHCIYLGGIFLVCIWNGANYYFEIFTETYTDRLQRFLKDAKASKKAKKQLEAAQNAEEAQLKESLSHIAEARQQLSKEMEKASMLVQTAAN